LSQDLANRINSCVEL